MSIISTSASLRIFTAEENLTFISQALQTSASVQYLKGELRSKRNPQSAVFEESVWIYRSPLSSSADLHAHLECLLDLLESKHSALESIRSRLLSIDLFCMFSSENGQGSAEFTAELLGRLANQRIDLSIDLYPT